MGVLSGLKVLDLSSGIAGPMTAMLLGDQGADVTRIEPPGGDPWRSRLSGYAVWNRGKRSACLDIERPEDRARLVALGSETDILIESFAPGIARAIGLDYGSLAEHNPRLIQCSLTGYGSDGPDASRPAIDGLVAARTGQQWESRGVPGGTIARLANVEGMMPGLEAPEGCWVGPDREGPLFSGVPWASLGAFYIASVGINAAVRVRELTGRGQHVSASLLHGVLATTVGAWQQVEKPDAPYYQTWIFDPRAPKGFFRASDGRWTHHWVPLPEFVLAAAAGEMVPSDALPSPKQATLRVSTAPEDMVVLHAYQDELAEAVARFPAQAWVDLAASVGVPVQAVRSPEEALLDPLLVSDGCVTEVDDPELGVIRQVGRVVELSRHPQGSPSPARPVGADTTAVVSQADALIARGPAAPVAPVEPLVDLLAPLSGITVLDLGLAVAAPFGAQVLAQLGARVIKVNTVSDTFWFSNHIAMCCNRDKESITLNLKDPRGMEVLSKLVAGADVVLHNMRYDAAVRLGVDYDSLRSLNPALVYCHSLGHEQGPRREHPGNDQTAGALAGTTWLDGGMDHGGRPVWSCLSLGDTGNGFLAALGVIQALFDRDRTGEGQLVRTSILYAHLLNASMSWVTPDGQTRAQRQSPDGEQFGWHALYRLYETADGGWLCIAALEDSDWLGLCEGLDLEGLALDHRFLTSDLREQHDGALAEVLAEAFLSADAAEWFKRLDALGVPCEISDSGYVQRLFARPDALAGRLVASFRHRNVGQMRMAGAYFDLSDTPGVIQGPPVWPGEDTRTILVELGYTSADIDRLIEAGVVDDTSLVDEHLG